MFRVFRTVVMWLMALAMPLQGLAAAVAPLCEAAGHTPAAIAAFHPAVTLAASVLQAGVQSVDSHHGHSGHHTAAPSQMGHSAGHADQADHAGRSDHVGHGGHACCSAASSVASVFTSDLFARQPAPTLAPAAPAVQRYQGVVLDGLDRPPRLLLA
jgi:hypothetical protein